MRANQETTLIQMDGPAVHARGLVKHYKSREGTVEAVRGVDLEWSEILPGFGVVAVMGTLMLALSVRMIENYD